VISEDFPSRGYPNKGFLLGSIGRGAASRLKKSLRRHSSPKARRVLPFSNMSQFLLTYPAKKNKPLMGTSATRM